MSTTNLAAPVSQTERIVILDSLRGIAILGILLMNIPGFSRPGILLTGLWKAANGLCSLCYLVPA